MYFESPWLAVGGDRFVIGAELATSPADSGSGAGVGLLIAATAVDGVGVATGFGLTTSGAGGFAATFAAVGFASAGFAATFGAGFATCLLAVSVFAGSFLAGVGFF
mgnify:CR=1 FL=1